MQLAMYTAIDYVITFPNALHSSGKFTTNASSSAAKEWQARQRNLIFSAPLLALFIKAVFTVVHKTARHGKTHSAHFAS